MATERDSSHTPIRDEKIAVIGSGLIGRSWAMLFASGGYQVALYDLDPQQTEHALVEISDQLCRLHESGQGRGTLSEKEQIARISTCLTLKDAVEDAVYIQECVPEIKDLKRKVLKDIDDIMSPTSILGSSTSAMMPSLLSDHLSHKTRFLVAHPANPPFYVPLVEIVPAPWTEQSATETTEEIMAAIEQVPVVFLKEVDGFGIGRVQFAIQGAAYELIKNGFCDVDDIETAMTEGLGMWYAFYGPFQIEHLNADGFVDLCNKYGADAFEVQKTFGQPEKVEGETAKKMASDLEKFCPLDDLALKRQWRDDRLAALSALIKKLDKGDIRSKDA